MEQQSVLVLGGSEFVGRAVVEEALARGWAVTTFNRGTRPAPAGVEALHGDRTDPSSLGPLQQGRWDVVLDTWSWAPVAVRDTAAVLADRVGRYVYVSSRSVHEFPTPAGADETAPVVDASPDDGPDVDYARAKRGAELAVEAAFGDRAVFARAGLVLGPYENVGRLPWWLSRIARGGDVLAPGPSDLPLQYVDARDLASWCLDVAVGDLHGPFNVVSEPGHATMEQFLDACVRVAGPNASLLWTDPEIIRAAGIEPWTQLPVWVPPGELHDALHRADVSRARAAGLRCRPVEDTVRDTWGWLQDQGGSAPQRGDRNPVGLPAAVEAAVLRGDVPLDE